MDVETIGATVAASLGLDATDVDIIIVSMYQEVQQTIVLPGDAGIYIADATLAQLKSGLVAYLNSQLEDSGASIDGEDVTVTVRTGESGRRLQTGSAVAVDYSVVSTTSIEAASTHSDFVT